MQILTPQGYIPIEDAVPGTELLYFDLETGEKKINFLISKDKLDKATWEENPEEVGLFDFYLINNTQKRFKNESIWADLRIKHVFDLQIGDIIYDDADNDVEVTDIKKIAGIDEDVWWRLHVTGDHSYIADGLTFHNATYYARNVTGNWAANTSWDAASSGGAGPAGPPVAGDTAIFDSGFTGNITVAAAAACTVLTCQAGATGTLTFSTSYLLTVAGNVTFVSGFNLAGSGITSGGLTISAASTIDFGGLTLPANLNFSGSVTYTLASNLVITGTFYPSNYTCTLAGAYNITCGTLQRTQIGTLTLVSGQTLTVTSAIAIGNANLANGTIKSSVASSAAYLTYQGTAANCKIAGFIFTDIDASGSAVSLLNWYGGTLTRTENIYNVTAADFPAVADVESGVEYGGVDDGGVNRLTGTLSPDFPAVGNVLHNDTVDGVAGTLYASNIGTALGAGSNLSAGILKDAEVVDDVTGTYDPVTGNYTDPAKANVLVGNDYLFAGVNQVAEYIPDFPAVGNVRDTDTVDGVPGTLLSNKILKSNVTGSGAGNYDDDNLAAGNVRPVAFGLGAVGDLSNLIATDAAYVALENSRNNDNGTVAADIITTKSVKIRNTTINGTFDEPARNIDPGEANVKNGIAYRILNVAKTGTYIIAVLVAHAKGLLLGVYK